MNVVYQCTSVQASQDQRLALEGSQWQVQGSALAWHDVVSKADSQFKQVKGLSEIPIPSTINLIQAMGRATHT